MAVAGWVVLNMVISESLCNFTTASGNEKMKLFKIAEK
jgi:hypothetical protein